LPDRTPPTPTRPRQRAHAPHTHPTRTPPAIVPAHAAHPRRRP
jgi:hypothetical protein